MFFLLKKNFRLFLILFVFSFASFNLEARSKTDSMASFRFGTIMKPYFSFNLNLYHDFSKVNTSSSFVNLSSLNSLYKFENMSFDIGLRAHKYFGVEFSIDRFVYKSKYEDLVGSFNATAIGLDFLFYIPFPILYLDMIGTGLEFYGGVGPALFFGKQTLTELGPTRFSASPAIKYSVGLQLRILNKVSLKFGTEIYQMKIPNTQIYYGNLVVLKAGITYYFL